jgi:hypothetical protein
VRVDGDRLFLEVAGTGPSAYMPYGRQLVDLN